MIDLHHLRQNPDAYKKACQIKNVSFDVDAFLQLDQEYRLLKTQIEEMRSRQNQFSRELPKLSGAEKEQKTTAMKGLAQQLKTETETFRQLESRWEKEQLYIPGIPLASVPVGRDDSENVEIRKWGYPREFDFSPLDHAELGKNLDIIDVERGVKIAGARNYFLKGDGARLMHALMNLAMDHLYSKGFILMDPPHIVRYEAMMGTSYFPGGEDQAYQLDERDLGHYLIGTAEVPVTSYHSNEILDESELPKRYAGHSPCYRREAGTYGKDTAGIFRVHQFYKVEQVIICRNEVDESAQMHAELLQNSEEIMQMLQLPYRVVSVCTGDMGLGQVFKHDIEAWIPSRQKYSETHSCSTFHDFQSRRLNLRYKNAEGKNLYCHTLNNTCVASTRMLMAIIENYQTRDGQIQIPEVLRAYMRGQEFISIKKM